MTREEKVFQMALAVAPTIADFGLSFTRQLINEKKNPQDFTFNGKSIPTAHGELLREWAEAFVDELEERGINMVHEWCPYCVQDVLLKATMEVQRCPECGTWIVPCAMCQGRKCQGCDLEEKAKQLNRQEE